MIFQFLIQILDWFLQDSLQESFIVICLKVGVVIIQTPGSLTILRQEKEFCAKTKACRDTPLENENSQASVICSRLYSKVKFLSQVLDYILLPR